eukprot:COSAG01_NODE_429_length_17183_cov_22.990869_1_plen_101_part_00
MAGNWLAGSTRTVLYRCTGTRTVPYWLRTVRIVLDLVDLATVLVLVLVVLHVGGGSRAAPGCHVRHHRSQPAQGCHCPAARGTASPKGSEGRSSQGVLHR